MFHKNHVTKKNNAFAIFTSVRLVNKKRGGFVMRNLRNKPIELDPVSTGERNSNRTKPFNKMKGFFLKPNVKCIMYLNIPVINLK
jgi:hypothetical protein